MESIQVRNPRGEELRFLDQEELARAITGGAVTADWQIFESLSGQWVAMDGRGVSGRLPGTPARMSPRSKEVVLIYPAAESAAQGNFSSEVNTDPLDLVSILTPDEIDRVLGRRPRSDGPQAAIANSG
jgi:hypothetical protein